MPRPSPHRAGYTLLEMLISSAIGVVTITAAMTLACFQIRAFRGQGEVTRMHSSTQAMASTLVSDLTSAGFGTTFYAGAPLSAFGGNVAVIAPDGTSLGVPALRILDNATSVVGAPSDSIMPGADAVMVLRIEGLSTSVPPAGQRIPAIAGNDVPYLVRDPSLLADCASRGLLVLVTDYGAWEPASSLFALSPFAAAPVPGVASAIAFQTAFGIDPGALTRPNDGSAPPGGLGLGSTVTCVRPVTYWLDRRARLRRWKARRDDPGSAAAIVGTFGRVPINPGADEVIAEGIEDLQLAVEMSGASASFPNAWTFAGSGDLVAEAELAEARSVRISAVARTSRSEDEERAAPLPVSVENHVLPALNRHFHYRLITHQTELRNLRLFDSMSSRSRTTAQIRSYP